jgi:hypothetical protein
MAESSGKRAGGRKSSAQHWSRLPRGASRGSKAARGDNHLARAIGCFAYGAQCAFDRLSAMRLGGFGIECAYGAICAKSIVAAAAGYAGKNLASAGANSLSLVGCARFIDQKVYKLVTNFQTSLEQNIVSGPTPLRINNATCGLGNAKLCI